MLHVNGCRQASLLPVCLQCPLMRHPGGQQLLCVNCGHDSAAGDASGNAAAQGHMATAAEASPADVATASATRLQRLPNGTADVHASSGEEDEEEEELLQPPPPLAARLRQAAASADSQPRQQLGSTAAAADTAGGSRQRQGEDDASARIADMMLEGWAMLQEHCPRWGGPTGDGASGRFGRGGRALLGPRCSINAMRGSLLFRPHFGTHRRMPLRPQAVANIGMPALALQVFEPAAALARPPHLLCRLPDVCCARGRDGAAGCASRSPGC